MKWMIFFYNFTKKKLFGTWKFGKIDVLINFNFFPQFSQFFLWEVNLRGLRAFILQNVQGSVVETEKKVLLPITQLGKEETLIILLSAWDRSRDSTQKRNLSKHMWRTLCSSYKLNEGNWVRKKIPTCGNSAFWISRSDFV